MVTYIFCVSFERILYMCYLVTTEFDDFVLIKGKNSCTKMQSAKAFCTQTCYTDAQLV